MKFVVTLEKGTGQKKVEVNACNVKQAKAQAVLQNPGWRAVQCSEISQADMLYWRKQS